MNFDGHKPVQRRREDSDNQMKEIDALLKTMQSEIAAIQQAAKLYSPSDLDPYKAAATKLHLTLAEIQRLYADQAGQLDDLSKKASQSPGNFLDRFLVSLGVEPYYWWQRSQPVDNLFKAAHQLQDMINEAKSLLEKQANQPLEVAHRARELRQDIEGTRQIAAGLVVSGVRGDRLSIDKNEVERLETKLQTISDYFFGSDDLVKQNACKEDVCAAWSILKEIEKPSKRYLREFQRWQAEYRIIRQRLAGVRTEIDAIETCLDEISSSIGPIVEVEKLKQAFRERDQDFLHLTIEQFADFDIEVTEVIDEANSLAQKVKEIEEKWEEAQKRSHQVDEELKALMEIHPGLTWIKEPMGQVDNMRNLLKQGGSVARVLDELRKLTDIYERMLREASKQIWRHRNG